MSVQASFNISMTVEETLSSGVDGAENPIITHDGFDVTGIYSSTTTPDVEYCVVKTIALTAGAYTIDLSSMTGTNGAAVVGTGKKIRLLRITNNGANAMTFAKGASNGHTGLGSAFSATIPVGGTAAWILADGGVAIGSGDKTIDVSGTGTQTFSMTLVLG